MEFATREELLSKINATNFILLIFAYIGLRSIYQVIHYRFFHPLSGFPGPFWASVTRLWIAWHNVRDTELPILYALKKKYGPVVRITPTLLLFNDPLKLPEFYHRSADKTEFYTTGTFGDPEAMFNIRPHKEHAALRKHIAGLYKFSNMKKLELLMDHRIGDWLSQLDNKFAETGDAFDFSWWSVYLAYDVISEVGYGVPFGFIEQGKDVANLIRSLHQGFTMFGLLGRLHHLTNWIKTTFLKKYLVAKSTDDSGMGVLLRFRDKLIDKRLEDVKMSKPIDKTDFLQFLINARTEDDKPLDDGVIRAELLIVLTAGADTIASVFQGLVQYLLKNPHVYKQIESAAQSGLISQVAQYSEVTEHLPYYAACIYETMRLSPPGSTILPRYVSAPGADLYGTFVPPGTEVAANSWIGEDAEDFCPDRWLNPERAKLFKKYDFTFGYGSRACLGKDIATMELFKAPLQFLRRYRFEQVSEKPAAKFVLHGGIASWIDVWITLRQKSPGK
ncbi:cytochrome P450 [Penicillium malachiteum]|uniref:cytochrome P450 n=1 Tax=Penicillium malachiteum TaxID=1324776 RepID=UPI002548EC48|nr:cytochrome P450 [Penicillium malachiteum]KAJ5714376.1 cytochrome P450 [Penicillium malachiteum]